MRTSAFLAASSRFVMFVCLVCLIAGLQMTQKACATCAEQSHATAVKDSSVEAEPKPYRLSMRFDRIKCLGPVIYMRFAPPPAPAIAVLIDTGSRGLFLERSAALREKLEVKKIPQELLSHTTFGAQDYALVKTVHFTDSNSTEIYSPDTTDDSYIAIEVGHVPFLSGISQDTKIEGVCGIDLLRALQMNIRLDFAKNEALLYLPGQPLPASDRKSGQWTFHFAPGFQTYGITGTISSAGKTSSAAAAEGSAGTTSKESNTEDFSGPFEIDTGTWNSVLHLKSDSFKPVAESPEKTAYFRLDSTVVAQQFLTKEFHADADEGTLLESDIPFIIPPKSLPGRNLLGMSFLSRFCLTFDWQKNVVIFEPATNYLEAKRLSGNIGGLYIENSSGRWVVSHIYEWSPFARTVAVGDEVLSVDGFDISGMTGSFVESLRHGVAGDKATLVLKQVKSGGTYTIRFIRGSLYNHEVTPISPVITAPPIPST